MLDCLTKHFQIYCCSICSSVFVFKRLERNKIGLRVPAAVSYLLVKVLTQCKKKRSEAKGIVGLESEFRKSIHFFYNPIHISSGIAGDMRTEARNSP
jgi:hypothetical protein